MKVRNHSAQETASRFRRAHDLDTELVLMRHLAMYPVEISMSYDIDILCIVYTCKNKYTIMYRYIDI